MRFCRQCGYVDTHDIGCPHFWDGERDDSGEKDKNEDVADSLADIAIDLMKSGTEAYQQALALSKQGEISEGRRLQLWGDTVRSAAEQVAKQAFRLEGSE